jgi:hypothetical protein
MVNYIKYFIKNNMIYKFLNKRKKNKEKKELIILMINNLNIQDEQKELYLESINILNENEIDIFYNEISKFIENIEIKEIEDIKENSFSNIA